MKPGTRHFDRVNSRAEFNNYVPRNLFFFFINSIISRTCIYVIYP